MEKICNNNFGKYALVDAFAVNAKFSYIIRLIKQKYNI